MTTDPFLKPDEAGLAALGALKAEINALLEAHKKPATLDAAIADFNVEVEGTHKAMNRAARLRAQARIKPVLPVARRLATACLTEMLEVLNVYMGETDGIDESRIRLHSMRITQTQADGEALGKSQLKLGETFSFGAKEHLVAGFNCFTAVQSDLHTTLTGKAPVRVMVGEESAIAYSSSHILETRGLGWVGKMLREGLERTMAPLLGETYEPGVTMPFRAGMGVVVVPRGVGVIIEKAHAQATAASPPTPGKSTSVH